MSETKVEHPPIELDPVADFERARAAMEEQLQKLNAELAMEREKRMMAEQDRDLARQDLAATSATANQWKRNCGGIASLLKQQREESEKKQKLLREQIRKMACRPVRIQVAGMAGSAALSFLIAAAVEAQMVDHIIGEPMGYGCLVICGLFAGVLWERIGGRVYAWRTTHGDKRILDT